ncbi:O-antigen ligase family protein [Devosia albogilva]|uniref:O-antigen ligase family protein n=1 Tax=Devosia albogilva TaxID=429726 RepID=A0ABW5QM05_9HYPH
MQDYPEAHPPNRRLAALAVSYLPIAISFGSLPVWVGGSSLSVPFALALTLPLAGHTIVRQRATMPPVLLWLFAVLLLGVAISAGRAVTADEVKWSRAAAYSLPYACGFTVLFAMWGAPRPTLNLPIAIAGAVVAASVLAFTLHYYATLEGQSFLYDFKEALVTPLGGSNLLALFMVFCVPFAWKQTRKWLGVVLWCALAAAVWATKSRYGLGFFSLATVASAWHYWRPRDARLVISAVALISVAVLAGTALMADQHLAATAMHYGVPLSVVRRADLMVFAADLIQAQPLLGIGPGGFMTAIERSWTGIEVAVHNSILVMWLDGGMISLLALILIVVLFYLRASDPSLKMAVTLLLGFSLVEPALEVAPIIMLFCFAVGTTLTNPARTSRVLKKSVGFADET